MEKIFNINLAKLFEIESSVLELFIRGSVLYVGILILLRILPRRTGGELAIMDLIFVILIGEAASHALGDYTSLTEGFITVASLMFWDYMVNFLSFHFPILEKLIAAPPLKIVKDGKMLYRNMRKEYITESELMNNLREEGITDLKEVQEAFIESEGKISIIRRKS